MRLYFLLHFVDSIVYNVTETHETSFDSTPLIYYNKFECPERIYVGNFPKHTNVLGRDGAYIETTKGL